MRRMRATVAICVLLFPATMALADADLVAFPENYQETFTHYTTVNRADERKQVVKIFANETALASARDGAPLDSGSVILMEIYKAELDADEQPVTADDGFFVPGELAAVTVMETRDGWGANYPDAWRNDEWEYAAFTAGDHTLVERDYQPCFGCHKPLAEADFLFSFEALKQAAGGS